MLRSNGSGRIMAVAEEPVSAHEQGQSPSCTLDQQLAYHLIRPLAHSPLHPNHFTTLTLVLGLASATTFILAAGNLAWLGALLYMLAVFSDHLDGEFARLTGKTTRFGHDFDFVVGGINYTCLFIALGIGLYPQQGLWALLLGLMAGLANPLIVYLRMNMERVFGEDSVRHPRVGLFDIEDFIYLIGPITWLAGIVYFFVPFAAGTLGYLVWTLWQYHQYLKTDNLIPR